jgi:RNA polymerase sigma-70 factor (ECF subfamily)
MAQQDLERFEALVLSHLDDAYTLARYLLRDEHDAQDVVQDAALRAFRSVHQIRDGDPRAWFLAIVRNCCYTWQRRHRADRRFVPLDDHLTSIADESPPADALAVARSDRAAIERGLARLPLELREIIVLREIEDMSYAQIATVVGSPIGTVMSRLSRARRRLARALGAGAQEAG